MKTADKFLVFGLLIVFVTGSMQAMDESDSVSDDKKKPQAATGSASSLAWEIDKQDTLKDADVSTVDQARGNWFFKAKILKEARKVYDAIRKKLAKIAPLEDTYAEQRNKLDEKVNVFYQEFGFQQGEADERLDMLIEDVKKLEDTDGELDKDERNLLEELKQKKEDVGAVKLEFDELNKLNAALNKALVTLAGQMNKANTYDEQAWQNYEQIELTLSDELAQELLNKIQNNLDNIVGIEKYLNKEFKAFFDKSSKAVTTHVEKIKKQVIALKEQGIGLGKKMGELLAKEELAKQEQEQRERDRIKKELELAQKTWWNTFVDYVSGLFSSIKNGFISAYNGVAGLFVTLQPEIQGPVVSVEKPEVQMPELAKPSVDQPEVTMPVEPVVVPVPSMPVLPVQSLAPVSQPELAPVEIPEPPAAEIVPSVPPTKELKAEELEGKPEASVPASKETTPLTPVAPKQAEPVLDQESSQKGSETSLEELSFADLE